MAAATVALKPGLHGVIPLAGACCIVDRTNLRYDGNRRPSRQIAPPLDQHR